MHRRAGRQWRALALTAAAVVVTAVTAADAAPVVRAALPGQGSVAAAATPLRTLVPHQQPAGAPVPPADGAWVGAWVRPDLPTDRGRLDAVADFEQQLGRPLDVAHTYHVFDDAFPDASERALATSGHTVLLSWGGTDTRQIQSGLYDDVLRQRARALKAWGAPVLLEWRWEMDRPNLQAEVWSPADYVAAWRHLHDLFAEEGVTNAGWVWCPLASGFASGDAGAYYPGDDAVDWLCADTYPGKTVQSFATALAPFLAWARQHPQPIIIGEFGMKESYGEDVRQSWLAAAAVFLRSQPQIKAVAWFDADRSDSSTEAYDMSLRTAPGSMAVFRRMAQSAWFTAAR